MSEPRTVMVVSTPKRCGKSFFASTAAGAMKHAPVMTQCVPPNEPQEAQELRELDLILMSVPGPLVIGDVLADACIKRYGRLPANCEVLVVETKPALDMHSIGELLPNVVKRLRADLARDAANAWLFRERGAQWKRERNGRR